MSQVAMLYKQSLLSLAAYADLNIGLGERCLLIFYCWRYPNIQYATN